MPGPPEGGVVPAYHELAVGVGLRLPDLDPVVLEGRAQGVVELHGPASPAQHGLRAPGPGVGVAEDGPVLLQAGVDPGDKADAVIYRPEAGGVEQQAVLRIQVLVHAVHGGEAPLPVRHAAQDRPGVGLHVDPALSVLLCADLPVFGGDATDVPLAVPQDPLGGLLHSLGHLTVPGRVRLPAQALRQGSEMAQGPVVEEADHGALAAAQVQAVVPVCPQALTDAVAANLPGGKVQDALHMLIDRPLAAVGVGQHLVREGQVPGLPDVLHDAGHQPQGVVGAGVLEAVDDLALVRGGDHGGRLEGLLLLLRLEPPGLEEVQAVALPGQGLQQLHQTAPALVRVGVGHHHGVLGRIPVAQAHTAPYLDEGCKAGEHDIDLALVQVPDVQLRVHALVGGGDLEASEFPVPESGGPGKVLVRLRLGVLLPHGPSGVQAALAQQEQEPDLLAGLELHELLETTAVVAALLLAAAAFPGLYGQGVPLGAVGADELVPQALEAVGSKVCREELIAVLFVVQVVLDDPVLVPASGGVEAHLEVLIVHVDVVEAELQIAVYAQPPGTAGVVAQADVPDLHRVVHGHEQGLLRLDAAVVAEVFDVAQSVAAGIVLLGLAHGLPGDRPELAGLLVPQVDIVAGAVHGDAVGPEAGDAVILGGPVEQIPSRGVVEHAVHVLQTDVVGPGHRNVYPVDHIFPVLVVKITIAHKLTSCLFWLICVNVSIPQPGPFWKCLTMHLLVFRCTFCGGRGR